MPAPTETPTPTARPGQGSPPKKTTLTPQQQYDLLMQVSQALTGGGLTDEEIANLFVTGLEVAQARPEEPTTTIPPELAALAGAGGVGGGVGGEAGLPDLTPEEILLADQYGIPQTAARAIKALEGSLQPYIERMGLRALEAAAAKYHMTAADLTTAINAGLDDRDLSLLDKYRIPVNDYIALKQQATTLNLTPEEAVAAQYEYGQTPFAYSQRKAAKTEQQQLGMTDEQYATYLKQKQLGGGDAVKGAQIMEQAALGLGPSEYATYQDIMTGKYQQRSTELVQKMQQQGLGALTPQERADYFQRMGALLRISGPGTFSGLTAFGMAPSAEKRAAALQEWEEAHAREQKYLGAPAQEKAVTLAKSYAAAGPPMEEEEAKKKKAPLAAAARGSLVQSPGVFTVGEKGMEYAYLAPGSVVAPKPSTQQPTLVNAVRALMGMRRKVGVPHS